jgi:hypothetical protein
MKTISELTDFYYEHLYDDLQELDAQREQIKRKLIIINLVIALIAIAITIAVFQASDGNPGDGLFVPGVLGFVLAGVVHKFMTRDYTVDFKGRIIQPLIEAIDDNLSYSQNGYVSEYNFKRSKIFRHRIDRFSGNDLVQGKVDGIALKFSDIHAEYKTKDSKGRTTWHTLFNGLFIMAEFNKHFKGKTIVLPDKAEKMFGSLIGKWLQSKNLQRDTLVKMDDPEFEKHFVVYGTDQIESRYILTHSMMKRILDFKKRSGHNLFVSFVGSQIYMAIETGDNFEPSVYRTLLSYKQAMGYIKTLKTAIGVIDDLKLNQHLWSKLPDRPDKVSQMLHEHDHILQGNPSDDRP